SLKDGAGISQKRIWSAIVSASAFFTIVNAAWTLLSLTRLRGDAAAGDCGDPGTAAVNSSPTTMAGRARFKATPKQIGACVRGGTNVFDESPAEFFPSAPSTETC